MTLIDPATLRAKLASDNPPVVLDARWSGPAATVDEGHKDFEAGHIPGSLWVSMNKEMSNPDVPGGRHPLPDPGAFEAEMRRKGLNEDSSVVVLDGGEVRMDGAPEEVLVRADELRSLSLEVPFACRLSLELQAAGVPVSTCITDDTLKEELCALRSKM